jgi:hypothetical protein
VAIPKFPGYSPEQIALINSIFGKGGTGVVPPGKGVTRDLTPVLGPPPVGSYDSALDYNAAAASRGLGQTQNDANTAYEQGQQDYTLGLGDLTRGRDDNLADLTTNETRLNQDYGFQTSELGRNYGILGRQQAEGAAQRGVTSAGLLGKSAMVRAGNQSREQGQLDLGHNRGLEDIGTNRVRVGTAFDQGKLRLDLGTSRQFGGFNGNQIVNPLTGKVEAGSLLTGTQRAAIENDAFQGGILGQKIQQAQQGGFISPLLTGISPDEYMTRLKNFTKKKA